MKKASIFCCSFAWIILIIFCYREIYIIKTYLSQAGYQLSVCEYIYLVMSCGVNVPYSTLGYMLLCFNISTKHRRLSCVYIAVIYALCAIIFVLIFCYGVASKNVEWTEHAMMMSHSISHPVIPQIVFTNMNSIVSIVVATMFLIAFWSMLGITTVSISKVWIKCIWLSICFYVIFWNSIHLSTSTEFIKLNSIISLKVLLGNAKSNCIWMEILKALGVDFLIILFSEIVHYVIMKHFHKGVNEQL